MRKFTALIAALLILAVSLSLVACDTSVDIKTKYEDEGYTVSSLSVSDPKVKALFTLANYTEDEIEEFEDYAIFYCEKGINLALYIKFPSSAELRDELIDDGDTSAYDRAVDEGRINGNCLLIGSIGNADVVFMSE